MNAMLMSRTKETIEKYGQSVIATSNGDQLFAYTIGNAERGLPELLVIGRYHPSVLGGVLNDIGKIMRELGKPLPETVDLGGTYPVRIRSASDEANALLPPSPPSSTN